MTSKFLALIVTTSMMTFASPAMAQVGDEIKDQAVDMAKDKVMGSSTVTDMAKDKAMDMATDKVMGNSSVTDMAKDKAMDMATDKVMGNSSVTDMAKDKAMDMATDKVMGSHSVTDMAKDKVMDTGTMAQQAPAVINSPAPVTPAISCPYGTTAQPDNTCMVTGDYKY